MTNVSNSRTRSFYTACQTYMDIHGYRRTNAQQAAISRRSFLILTCAVTGVVACTAGEARPAAMTPTAAAVQKDVFIIVVLCSSTAVVRLVALDNSFSQEELLLSMLRGVACWLWPGRVWSERRMQQPWHPRITGRGVTVQCTRK